MTCKASLIAEASGVIEGLSTESGGVIGSVGIGSLTNGGQSGIEGVRGVGNGACLGAMFEAITE